MSYQRERDLFISQASKEGLDLPTIMTLLRHASTLQRLAVAQCNGDGERKTRVCGLCGCGWHPSAFKGNRQFREWSCLVPECRLSWHAEVRLSRHTGNLSGEAKEYCPAGCKGTVASGSVERGICPDCRTQELVTALLADVVAKCGQHLSAECTCGPEETAVKAIFGGDPRGAVLRLSTPSYPYAENGENGANGLYVPARER
jgi:hypothetical protein